MLKLRLTRAAESNLSWKCWEMERVAEDEEEEKWS
jgi:hypothetical protein